MQRMQNSLNNLEKGKSIAIKINMVLQKTAIKINEIELSPEINSYIFWIKDSKTPSMERLIVFSTNSEGTAEYPDAKE